MNSNESQGLSPAFQRLAQIMGCKWSMGILDAISREVSRPSRIEKELDGISTKVLHRCINRLESEGFLRRDSFDEIPPRVEYHFTAEGEDLVRMIREVQMHAARWRTLEPMEL
ncbi:MAG TPA: helix-turn-helix domain-containing protein [Fimbriimonadaceae bacterium]|nr:helix-turn-helix domain-containing protein [Fimbriimonadaceae bacterium]